MSFTNMLFRMARASATGAQCSKEPGALGKREIRKAATAGRAGRQRASCGDCSSSGDQGKAARK